MIPNKVNSKKDNQSKSNPDRYITKRYDGRSFRVRMSVHGVSIQATLDTVEDARAYRDRMLADATLDPTHRLVIQARQKKIGAEKDTLGLLLTRYKNEVSLLKKGFRTEKLRIDMINRFDIARLPMAMVNREAILRFIEQIRKHAILADGSFHKRTLSDCTLRKYLMLLSAFFEVANKRWGMNIPNPIREVEIPGNGTPRERRIEPGEFEMIIREIQSKHPIVELLILSVETACRRSELLNLRWKDVKIEDKFAILRNTKNDETRSIPLSLIARDILSNLPRNSNGIVFDISEHSISSAWRGARSKARKKYLEKCKIQNIRPLKDYLIGLRWHDLRHEATSRLFERGFDLMEVASVTGHKTLAMLRNYTHLRAQNLAHKLG